MTNSIRWFQQNGFCRIARISIVVVVMVELFGCRELVQDEFPDFTPVPTVNSILIADSIIKVHISLAGKMDTLEQATVDQADVQLFIDGLYKETLQFIDKGIYVSTSVAEPGKSYQCKVVISGYDPVTCSDSLPMPDSILKIEHIDIAGKDEEGHTFPAIKFTFSNNHQERRYYETVIRYNTYKERWSYANLQDITDPVLLSEGLPIAVFSNDQINTDTYTMTLNYTTGHFTMLNGVVVTKLYPIVLELRSISYDYYLYQKQLYLYNTGRYPDFPTSAGVGFALHSNVRNGYGIFAGYSKFSSGIINPE